VLLVVDDPGAQTPLPKARQSPTVCGMTNDEGWRRYVDAGMAITQVTRARAEEFVRELVRSGEIERGNAQDRVEDLLRWSKERSEAFVQLVRNEVQSQLGDLGITTVEDLAGRVSEMLAAAGAAGRAARSKVSPEKGGSRRTASPTQRAASTHAAEASEQTSAAKKAVVTKKAAATAKAGATKKVSATVKASATKKAGTAKKASATKKAGTAKKAGATKKAGTTKKAGSLSGGSPGLQTAGGSADGGARVPRDV